MKNKEFNKFFTEEFNKQNSNPLTINDIFEENSFKHKTKFWETNKFWKLCTINLSCLLVICLVTIGILLNNNINILKNQNDLFNNSEFNDITFTDDNNVMTEEERLQAINICDFGFKSYLAKYVEINEQITMYIYSGIKWGHGSDYLKYQNIYFYVFTFKEDNKNIIITINNQEIVVNQNNRFGILTSIDKTANQEFHFTLTYNEQSQKYRYIA